MLTVKDVKEYIDAFIDYTSMSFKVRLCYIKDNKLCRLAMIDTPPSLKEFTEFINQQENLTRDMLVKSTDAHDIILGTYRILENGRIRDIDVDADVNRIKVAILAGSRVF